MENFNKEEVSVFENLNHRHQELLRKLSEVNERLHHSNISLGGEYPLQADKTAQNTTDGSHINNYTNQLDYMERELNFMFNHIGVLEYLVRK